MRRPRLLEGEKGPEFAQVTAPAFAHSKTQRSELKALYASAKFLHHHLASASSADLVACLRPLSPHGGAPAPLEHSPLDHAGDLSRLDSPAGLCRARAPGSALLAGRRPGPGCLAGRLRPQ